MRLVAMIAGAIFLLPVAARADQQVIGGSNGRIDITDETGERPGADGSGAPGRQVYGYWAVSPTPDGFCRERRYTYDQAEAQAYEYAYARATAEANGADAFPPCAPGAAAAAPPTPGEIARQFWDVRQLSSPTLAVTPDYAITGKPVYLRIGGPPSATFHVDNPLGPAVDIAATSRYIVDWGDGSPPTTTTSQGGPWPDGDVTHVYDRSSKAVTITVTQAWSATWTAAPGEAGVLDNLQTVGTLTLRVEQLQAVRR